MTPNPDQSLNENLKRAGYTTSDAGNGQKHIHRGANVLFTGHAGDVWAWLKEQGREQLPDVPQVDECVVCDRPTVEPICGGCISDGDEIGDTLFTGRAGDVWAWLKEQGREQLPDVPQVDECVVCDRTTEEPICGGCISDGAGPMP